jgi:hypothetical protein
MWVSIHRRFNFWVNRANRFSERGAKAKGISRTLDFTVDLLLPRILAFAYGMVEAWVSPTANLWTTLTKAA